MNSMDDLDNMEMCVNGMDDIDHMEMCVNGMDDLDHMEMCVKCCKIHKHIYYIYWRQQTWKGLSA